MTQLNNSLFLAHVTVQCKSGGSLPHREPSGTQGLKVTTEGKERTEGRSGIFFLFYICFYLSSICKHIV